MRRSTPTILLLLALNAPTRADLIRFRAGGEADLPVRVEGDAVVIEAPSGPLRFPRSAIRSIEPRPDPAAIAADRIAEAERQGNSDARFRAALEALEAGRTDPALDAFRSLHEADPNHPGAARVAEVLRRLEAPLPGPDPAAFAVLGPDHSRNDASAPHFALWIEPPRQPGDRAAILERVLITYYVAFAARGIVLDPPRRKLVVAWYADQESYQDYLRRDGARAFLDTHGYYHPTRRLVVAHDERGRDPTRRRLADLESARAKLPPDDPRRRDLDRRQLLLDLQVRELEIGTAAHELIHLLVAESGLAPRFEDFPIWLHEGLAMQFEPVRGGRWAGPAGTNAQRLALWRTLPAPPPLLPLLHDDGFGRGYRAARYAAAWALVHDAWTHEPDEFLAFLDLLRVPAPPDPNRPLAAFRTAFGPDLAAYERAWHRRMGAAGGPE